MKNTFSKAERLCSKKWIEELYKQGFIFKVYPLKITALQHSYATEKPVMIMVSSPKHLFKHAKDRNLTKRRMRESYRKNKHYFIEKCLVNNQKYFISFQFASKKIEPYALVELALIKALQKIESKIVTPQVKD
jgi:ribonuclease P protein component